MATATKAPHAAITAGFKAGGFAIFKGYAEIVEGQEPILEKGVPVRLDRFEGDADIVVVAVDDDGNDILDEATGQPKLVERCFPEELEAAELEEGDEAPEEAALIPAEPEPAKPAKRTAKAAKPAAAPVEAAPVAEAAPAAPAKRTAKAKPAVAAAPVEPAAKPETAAAKKKREAAEAKEAAAAEKAATVAANKEKANKAKADKKAKAATPAIKATAVVAIADMASVVEILAEQDALSAAKSLVEKAEQTDFTLGGVLRHIHETGAFKSIGYEGKKGFDDYVRNTLSVEPRKARYLMQIYTAFAMIGADEEKLTAIGWSKAKELARIPADNLKKDFDKLIGDATDMTREDLIAKIKKTYKVTTRGGSGDGVSLSTFTFRLAEEEAQTVTDGLKEAGVLAGDPDNLNKALAYIVGEWRNGAAGSDLSLEDTLVLLQSKFGLGDITYVDPEGATMVFEAEPAEAAEATA